MTADAAPETTKTTTDVAPATEETNTDDSQYMMKVGMFDMFMVSGKSSYEAPRSRVNITSDVERVGMSKSAVRCKTVRVKWIT